MKRRKKTKATDKASLRQEGRNYGTNGEGKTKDQRAYLTKKKKK